MGVSTCVDIDEVLDAFALTVVGIRISLTGAPDDSAGGTGWVVRGDKPTRPSLHAPLRMVPMEGKFSRRCAPLFAR
jgi:hypothetical protein